MENISTEVFFKEFKNILEDLYQKVEKKSLEYSKDADPFHNFNVGSSLTGLNSESVLHGFLLKHIISYIDHINHQRQTGLPLFDNKVLTDKVEDIIVFMIIEQIMNKELPKLPF